MSSNSKRHFSSLNSLAAAVNFIPWLSIKDSLSSLSVLLILRESNALTLWRS